MLSFSEGGQRRASAYSLIYVRASDSRLPSPSLAAASATILPSTLLQEIEEKNRGFQAELEDERQKETLDQVVKPDDADRNPECSTQTSEDNAVSS